MAITNRVRWFRTVAISALFAAALLVPGAAWCDEPLVYYTRHFTIWYYSEDGFNALEDTLREGPLAGIARYGQESDCLAVRIERLYGLTASSLRAFPQGHRLRTVLLDEGLDNSDIFNKRGLSLTEGSACYDPVTKTLYVYPCKAGLCDITLELASAILHADDRLPARAGSSVYVSAECASEVCGYFTEGYLSDKAMDGLLY